ncbi:MAG: alpha/beta hydrolase family protein [Gemmatimonadales bacterium]
MGGQAGRRAGGQAGALLVAVLLASVTPGRAQEATYVVRQGTDTVMIETVRRMPGALEATLLDRLQRVRWRYAAAIAPDETVIRFEHAYFLAVDSASAEPRQRAALSFEGDTVIVTIEQGGQSRVQRIGSRAGALPFINPSFVLVEQAIRRARVLGRDSARVPLFGVSGGQTFEATILLRGRDSAEVRIGPAMAQFQLDREGMLVAGSVPAQRLVLERTAGVLGVGVPSLVMARENYAAPAGAPWVAEAVSIPSADGVRLAGTLALPAGASVAWKVGAVVLISGSGPQDRDEHVPTVRDYRPFREIADTLARRGIAVLRYDDRGFGESTGDFPAATPLDFAQDVRAAVAWLRARPEIAPGRVGLIGHSEGGLVAPIVAADDKAIGAVVLLAAPARRGREILEYQQRYQVARDTTLDPTEVDSALAAGREGLDSLSASNRWWSFVLGYDPLPTAVRLGMPVLILHGETDRQVTSDQANELATSIRAGGNARVTVHVFAQTNHLFLSDTDGNPAGYARLRDRKVRKPVLGLLADWLVAVLR